MKYLSKPGNFSVNKALKSVTGKTGREVYKDFSEVLIKRYETLRERFGENQVNLVPKEIIRTSAKYWAKIFRLYYLDNDTGNWYLKRDMEKEADRAIEFVFRNRVDKIKVLF